MSTSMPRQAFKKCINHISTYAHVYTNNNNNNNNLIYKEDFPMQT